MRHSLSQVGLVNGDMFLLSSAKTMVYKELRFFSG